MLDPERQLENRRRHMSGHPLSKFGLRSRRLVLVAIATVSGAGLFGCSSSAAPEPTGPLGTGPAITTQAAVKSTALTAFRLQRPARSQGDLARAATALATVLNGGVPAAAGVQAAVARAAPAGAGAADFAIPGVSGLQFSFRGDNDRHLAFNANVTSDVGATADVGVDAANGIFHSAFSAAQAQGLASTGLNPADARTSRILQGEGVSGQAPVEKVSEYIFTVPRKVNGIEVFDAGFEVSVHRTGRIARVSMFGPTVASNVTVSGVETPDSSGYSFAAAVDSAALDARVAAEHPNAEIKSIGVRYWLPPGQAGGVVEPAQMYFVVPTATVNGERLLARGFYKAYSLKVAGQPPVVWPAPENNPPGDGQK
jgi:hypothetical protein